MNTYAVIHPRDGSPVVSSAESLDDRHPSMAQLASRLGSAAPMV